MMRGRSADSKNIRRTHPAEDEWERLGDHLPSPTNPSDANDLVWREFVAVFRWYDRAATRNRRGHQILRLTTLGLGAVVTVLAAVNAPPPVTAMLAAAIVIAEGTQQLYQFHSNWITYRSTAESLRRQAFLFAARAAPYDGPNRRELLAAGLRDTTSIEQGAWAASMQQALPSKQAPG